VRVAVGAHTSSSSDLMYSTVLPIRGMTTVSSAFTRRDVTLIASSRMVNDVCSVASCTRTSTAFEKVVRAFAICCPPFDRPVHVRRAGERSDEGSRGGGGAGGVGVCVCTRDRLQRERAAAAACGT
jgi:hypothetical protein